LQNPFLVGKKLYLRSLEKTDLEGDYLRWLNDPQVTEFMASGSFPYSRERLEEYYKSMVASNDNVLLAIIDMKANKHIGNIRLGPIDWVNRVAPLGLMIGQASFWNRGYGAEVIRLSTGYAFTTLNMGKVKANVIATNEGSLKAFRKAGFHEEGRAKNEFYRHGMYYDVVYLGITRDQFLSSKEG